MRSPRIVGANHRSTRTLIDIDFQLDPTDILLKKAELCDRYAQQAKDNNDRSLEETLKDVATAYRSKQLPPIANTEALDEFTVDAPSPVSDDNLEDVVDPNVTYDFTPPTTPTTDTGFYDKLSEVLDATLATYMSRCTKENASFLRITKVEDAWVLLKGSVTFDHEDEAISVMTTIDGLSSNHPANNNLYYKTPRGKTAVAVDTNATDKFFIFAIIPEPGMMVRYFSRDANGKDVPLCKYIVELLHKPNGGLNPWVMKPYAGKEFEAGYRKTEARRRYRIQQWKEKQTEEASKETPLTTTTNGSGMFGPTPSYRR